MAAARKTRRERKAEAERVARFHAAREAAVRGSAGAGMPPGYGPAANPSFDGAFPASFPAGAQSPRHGGPRHGGPQQGDPYGGAYPYGSSYPDAGPEMGSSGGQSGGLGARRSGLTPPELREHGRDRRDLRPWDRQASAVAVTGIVLVAAGMIATVWRGAAVMGHGWRPWALASTGTVTALAGWGLWRFVQARRDLPMRLLTVTGSIALGVVGLFTLGAIVSPVVDGRIVPVTSKEAKVQRDALSMRDDLVRLGELDELLTLDAATGRARFSSYQPAIDELEAMSAKWATRNPDTLADGDLAPVAADLASGAGSAALAMAAKRDLLTTDDSRLASTVATNRESFAAAVLDAGPRLASVAERYGFSVSVDDAQGPTE